MTVLKTALANYPHTKGLKDGTVSVPGVYGGWIDKVPFGSVVNRSLTIKTGQTHVQRYLEPLLGRLDLAVALGDGAGVQSPVPDVGAIAPPPAGAHGRSVLAARRSGTRAGSSLR